MRQHTHARTDRLQRLAATRTPARSGSVLVTVAVVAALPVAMLALAYPVAVAALLVGTLAGIAVG